MSVAAPITTLAGHIAALQRAGAVAIWPLDDSVLPGSGQSFREANEAPWFLQAIGGQVGEPGAYPDATSYGISAPGTPWATTTPQTPWPPLNQSVFTFCFWVFHPATGTAWTDTQFSWSAAPVWVSDPWWGVETGGWVGAGLSWPTGNAVINVDTPTVAGLRNRWTHITTVFTSTQARLYLDGHLYAQASISNGVAQSTGMSFIQTSGSLRLQAMALFDRALTDQEVEGLLYQAAPPTAATKVWNGSTWQAASIKGWDGSQWKPGKVWDGSQWR